MQFTDKINLVVNPFTGGNREARYQLATVFNPNSPIDTFEKRKWQERGGGRAGLAIVPSPGGQTPGTGGRAGYENIPSSYNITQSTDANTFLGDAGITYFTSYNIDLVIQPVRIELNCLIVPSSGVGSIEVEGRGNLAFNRTVSDIFVYCSIQDYNRSIADIRNTVTTLFRGELDDIPDNVYTLTTQEGLNAWYQGLDSLYALDDTEAVDGTAAAFSTYSYEVGTSDDQFGFIQLNRLLDGWTYDQSVISFDFQGLPANPLGIRTSQLVSENLQDPFESSDDPTVDELSLQSVQFFYSMVKFTLRSIRTSVLPPQDFSDSS